MTKANRLKATTISVATLGPLILLTLAAAAMLWASTALAQTVPRGNLDANCQANPTQDSRFNPDQQPAQTFTAVNSGKLTSAQVLVRHSASDGPGDYVLKIATVDTSGVPTKNFLASATIPKSSIPSDGEQMITANFPVDSAAQVVAGRTYALIVQRGNNDTLLTMPYRVDNPCPGGSVYWSTAGGPFFQIDGNRDFIFATYVTPDTQAPRVDTAEPTGTGVTRAAVATVTFSEEMKSATVSNSSVKLYKYNKKKKKWQPISDVAVSCDDPCRTATLDPYPSDAAKLLGANTKHKVTVATTLEDLAGNRLDQQPAVSGSQPKSWTFTTGSR